MKTANGARTLNLVGKGVRLRERGKVFFLELDREERREEKQRITAGQFSLKKRLSEAMGKQFDSSQYEVVKQRAIKVCPGNYIIVPADRAMNAEEERAQEQSALAGVVSHVDAWMEYEWQRYFVSHEDSGKAPVPQGSIMWDILTEVANWKGQGTEEQEGAPRARENPYKEMMFLGQAGGRGDVYFNVKNGTYWLELPQKSGGRAYMAELEENALLKDAAERADMAMQAPNMGSFRLRNIDERSIVLKDAKEWRARAPPPLAEPISSGV